MLRCGSSLCPGSWRIIRCPCALCLLLSGYKPDSTQNFAHTLILLRIQMVEIMILCQICAWSGSDCCNELIRKSYGHQVGLNFVFLCIYLFIAIIYFFFFFIFGAIPGLNEDFQWILTWTKNGFALAYPQSRTLCNMV